MEWIQLAIILVTFIGLFIWERTESRANMLHVDVKLDSIRELVRTIHLDGLKFKEEMLQESKDFHGRLCASEERYLQSTKNK